MTYGDKPVKEFRAGSVRASTWQDEVAGKDEEPWSVFSVRIEKRYWEGGRRPSTGAPLHHPRCLTRQAFAREQTWN